MNQQQLQLTNVNSILKIKHLSNRFRPKYTRSIYFYIIPFVDGILSNYFVLFVRLLFQILLLQICYTNHYEFSFEHSLILFCGYCTNHQSFISSRFSNCHCSGSDEFILYLLLSFTLAPCIDFSHEFTITNLFVFVISELNRTTFKVYQLFKKKSISY